MKLFKCQSCGNVIYFENYICSRCGHRLGFVHHSARMSALKANGGRTWRPVDGSDAPARFCANAALLACNWLIPADSTDRYCRACRHNGIIPNIADPQQQRAWRDIELAKHRLIYSLLRLKLPVATRAEDPQHGLLFAFLADPPQASGPKVMTGHNNGLITLALAEADDAEREARRKRLGEPYRTLVGHFRHEVGHYYWDILVRDRGRLDACRAVFGDDRQDYGAALQRHYAEGAPPDWSNRFVSAYATVHAWEDFAETWAHYLHIVDTLETIWAFGMQVAPSVDERGGYSARVEFDPYDTGPIQRLVAPWFPFTLALNSVGRSIGRGDLYPFVLSPVVITKLGFIHQLIHGDDPSFGATG